jgi:Cu/Ag efflux pump CusA
MISLTAWIQNPNNDKPDFILKNGKLLSVENKNLREEIANRIFQIDELAKVIYQNNKIILKRFKRIYLAKFHVKFENDEVREMPVLMLINNINSNNLNHLDNKIATLFGSIPKTLNKKHVNDLTNLIESDLKQINIIKGTISLSVAIILALLLYYLINQY